MIEAARRGELDEVDLSKLSKVDRMIVMATLGVKDIILMVADATERVKESKPSTKSYGIAAIGAASTITLGLGFGEVAPAIVSGIATLAVSGLVTVDLFTEDMDKIVEEAKA